VGMASLLLDTDLDPQQHDYAETACRSAEALVTVINDILDFSKVEAGRLDIESIPFDLGSEVEAVADLHAARCAKNGVELLCAIDPRLPAPLRGDPTRIRQVVNNLLGNAIKFTERGEIEVSATLLEEDEAGLRVRIAVRDTGIGIPEGYRERLFEPFSQADVSTTRRYGGTGLGLAICKQLAELMGGGIEVESAVGEGSTFQVWVRLGRLAESQVAGADAALDGARLLLAASRPGVARVVTAMTAACGCRTEVVEGGDAVEVRLAAARKANDPYRIVVVDTEGEEAPLLDRLAAISIPGVVVLSPLGRLLASHRDETRQVVTRPVKRAALRRALLAALGHDETGGGRGPECDVDGPSDGDHLRILLVEDNLVNQKVAVHTLERMGHRVCVASDGTIAVEVVAEIDYDLVLMDCQMPVMDGYEATREIRRREAAGHHLPIIAMTANAMKGDREACLAAGMDDFLSKPIQRAALAAALARWGGGKTEAAKDTAAEATPVG